MKEKIVNGFNQGAVTYHAAADVQALIAQRLVGHLPTVNARKILEIGCGTGLFSQHLLDCFPRSSLLLTDIAPAMVDVCRERFGSVSSISVVHMDGESLMVPSMSFDLVASSMVFHWFSNLKQSLQGIVDTLVPRGELVFAMLGENSLREWSDICKKFNCPIATPCFPSYKLIQQSCSGIEIHIDTYQHAYSSLYAFLNSLKQLGAVIPRSGHVPLTPGKLRHLMRSFANKINISYEVIYGRYIKK